MPSKDIKTGNPGVQPISSRMFKTGWNNRHPILALKDDDEFNGTPITRYPSQSVATDHMCTTVQTWQRDARSGLTDHNQLTSLIDCMCSSTHLEMHLMSFLSSATYLTGTSVSCCSARILCGVASLINTVITGYHGVCIMSCALTPTWIYIPMS